MSYVPHTQKKLTEKQQQNNKQINKQTDAFIFKVDFFRFIG